MKKNIFCVLLFLIFIFSCSNESKLIELVTTKNLQRILDSIVAENYRNNTVYELFVDKGSEFGCDMLLHIGIEPYYNDNTLCLNYINSKGHKIKIYSGIESYFNLPGEQIFYGKANTIKQDHNHKLWVIRLYEDSIVDVYSVESGNPFLLLPASPKYYVEPEILD